MNNTKNSIRLHEKAKKEFINQPKKTDKNWLVIFIVFIIIITIISIVINITSQNPIPVQENSWNSITPGFKFTNNLQKNLGDPLEIKNTKDSTEYDYKSKFPIHNNTILVSKNGIVKFIKEYLTYNPEHTLERYTSVFGEPQLVMAAPQISDAVKAYVFLDKGVVVFAHIADNAVEVKWYFEPTTKEKFLESWGKELSQEESVPEAF